MENNYFSNVYYYDNPATPITPSSVDSTNNLFDFSTMAALLSPLTINNNLNYLTINDIDTSSVWSPISQPATYLSTFYEYKTQHQQQRHHHHQFKYSQRPITKTGSQSQSKDELNDSSSEVFSMKNGDKQGKMLPKRSENFDFSDLIAKASSKNGKRMLCNFCRNNNESQEIYTSHPLKDSLGRIICPILKAYACPKCGATGDYSHTLKYCPILQKKSKLNKIKKFANF